MRDKLGRFVKGYHSSLKTEFKKGHPAPKTAFKKGQNREKSPQWKTGKSITPNGYVIVLSPEHPFCWKNGYVPRARLVMEKYLNRFISRKEFIHPINDIKTDDNINNLKLFKSKNEHSRYHSKIRFPKGP